MLRIMELTKEQITKAALALPKEEQIEVADAIGESVCQLSGEEQDQIAAVLDSRIDGPFEPVGDLGAWKENIKQRGRERLATEGHA
jgi:hypothetical protein